MGNKGISTIIASVIMVVIATSLGGVFWLYVTGFFTSTTAQSFSIVDTFNDTITIRNDGSAPISSFSITTNGNPVAYQITSQDTSLVGFWKLDEGSGTVAYDSSVKKSNNGLLQNFYPLDSLASNPSLEDPWYLVIDQDATHRIERPDNWNITYSFGNSTKMLAVEQTSIVRDGSSAINLSFSYTGTFFPGSISINDCNGSRFQIDETKYLEGGNFQKAIKGPSTNGDQSFQFYDASNNFLSRRWASPTNLDVDAGNGWRMKSYIWQPSYLNASPPTQGGYIPYIPAGAKYACFVQYFVYQGGTVDWEKIFDKFFIQQWSYMPTNQQRISRVSSGWVDGELGEALQFDGVDDYVSVSSSSSLNIGSNQPITISGWINPKTCGNGTSYGTIIQNYPGTGQRVLLSSSCKLVFQLGSGLSTLTSNAVVPLNAWTYFAAVYNVSASNLSNLSLYVNGTFDSIRAGYSANPSSGNLTIGYSGEPYQFNGTIDEVKIYSGALTSEKITADYKGGQIDSGSTAVIKIDNLSQGTHKFMICTSNSCRTAIMTI